MRGLTRSAVGVERDELVAVLRRAAGGYSHRVGAAELLICHGHWLSRAPFLQRVGYYPADTRGAARVVVDWSAIGALLDGQGLGDTESGRCVLGVAASLAGGYRVDLSGVRFRDTTNVGLITVAVGEAGGLSGGYGHPGWSL